MRTVHAVAIPNTDHDGYGTPPAANQVLNNVQSPNPTSPGSPFAFLDSERQAEVIFDWFTSSESLTPLWYPCDPEAFSIAETITSQTHWKNALGATLGRQWITDWCDEQNQFQTINAAFEILWDRNNQRSGRDRNADGTWGPWGDGSEPAVWPGLAPLLPLIRQEHCNIRVNVGDDITPSQLTRRAQASMVLKTGGRSIHHSDLNLFVFNGRAQEVFERDWNDPNVPSYEVSSERISIGPLGRLGYDGKLYKVLADNQTIEITPNVESSEFYHFEVQATKHRLITKANGVTLDRRRVVNEAKFCVGQKIILTSDFEPEVYGIRHTDFVWRLPDKYVNARRKHLANLQVEVTTCHPATTIRLPNGTWSPEFFVYSDVLQLKDTGAWWYSGGTKRNTCRWEMEFSNRQTATVIVSGLMNMHRPTVDIVPRTPDEDNRFFVFRSWDELGLFTGIYYGDPNFDDGRGTMRYSVNVHSEFRGRGTFTQVANVDYSNFAFQIADALDGPEFYNDPPQRIFKSGEAILSLNPFVNHINVQDGPRSSWWMGNHRVKGDFKDYFRFKPGFADDDNIYVTLGISTWSMHAEIRFGVVTSNDHPGPIGPNSSDSFPTWSNHIRTGP
jgi:hypothetical protein